MAREKLKDKLNLSNLNWAGYVAGKLLEAIRDDGYKLRLSIDVANRAIDVDLVKKGSSNAG